MTNAYPDAPGYKARETSRAAAQSAAPMAMSLRARIFEAIRAKPDTAEGLAKRLREDLLNVRPRCAELAARNLIEDSGTRGPSRSGKSSIVWWVRV